MAWGRSRLCCLPRRLTVTSHLTKVGRGHRVPDLVNSICRTDTCETQVPGVPCRTVALRTRQQMLLLLIMQFGKYQ